MTFIVVYDTTEEPRSIRLPVWFVRAGALLLAVVIVLAALGALTYSKVLSKASIADDLQAENQILRDYTERVHTLEQDLMTNRLLLRKMMELAGIEIDSQEHVWDSAMPESDNLAGPGSDGGAPLVSHSTAGREGADDNVPSGIPMQGTFSQGFRPDSSEGLRRHFGIDIAAKEGTPIFATAGGRVEFAGWDESYGNYLVIDHQNSYKTHYGHNKAILVSVGDAISSGELIALSGNTGRSSAPHLHYEIRLNGEAVDPNDYLDILELKQAE